MSKKGEALFEQFSLFHYPVIPLGGTGQALDLLPVQLLLQVPDDAVGHQEAPGRQAPAGFRLPGQTVGGAALQNGRQRGKALAEPVFELPDVNAPALRGAKEKPERFEKGKPS